MHPVVVRVASWHDLSNHQPLILELPDGTVDDVTATHGEPDPALVRKRLAPVRRDGAIVSSTPPLGRLVARSEVHSKLSAIVHQRWIKRALQVGREPLELDRLPLRPRLAVVRGEGRGDAIKVGGVVAVGIEVLERDEDLVAEARERRHPGASERVVRLADILRAHPLDRLVHDDVAVERVVLLLGERQGHVHEVHEERDEDGSNKTSLQRLLHLQRHDMRRDLAAQ